MIAESAEAKVSKASKAGAAVSLLHQVGDVRGPTSRQVWHAWHVMGALMVPAEAQALGLHAHACMFDH